MAPCFRDIRYPSGVLLGCVSSFLKCRCSFSLLLFACTTKQVKSISYLSEPTFGCHFLTKSPRDMGAIFLQRSRGWKDCLYVCLCVCLCLCVCMFALRSRGRNFYRIATKFGTQVGLVKIQVKFEDALCRSHSPRCRQSSSRPKTLSLVLGLQN